MLRCLASSILMSIRSEPLFLMIYELLLTFCNWAILASQQFLVSISICLSLSRYVMFKFIFFQNPDGFKYLSTYSWMIYVCFEWYITYICNYWTQVLSLPCLVTQSVLLLNFAQIVRFVKVVRWICQYWYLGFPKLIHGFL